MRTLAKVSAVILIGAAVGSPLPAAAQSATEVTGSGSGSFPSGAQYNGVQLRTLRFGKGVSMPGDGTASGDFAAVLEGTSATGQPQEITVQGATNSGSLNADRTASFAGVGSVEMGDGSPPATNVPFTVRVSTQAGGKGTIMLTLGSTTLPVAEATEGTLTNQTGGQVMLSKKDQSLNFGPLPAKTFGDAPFAVSASASSGLGVAFSARAGSNCTVSGNTVTLTGAGGCTVVGTQSGDGSYNAAAEVTQTLSIAKGTPSIAWAAPADITNPTALSATQLNATASVAGSFSYTPNGGTVLLPGLSQSLATTFSPADAGNYAATSRVVTLNVLNLIDIIPGSSTNVISLSDTKTKDILVALRGTPTFDAKWVDPATVTLGNGSASDPGVAKNTDGSLRFSIGDINADMKPDLLLYFTKAQLPLQVGVTTQLIMRGNFKRDPATDARLDGRAVKGVDKVQVIQ